MTKTLFTESDISILKKNKNVLRVSEKSITYTDEFRLHFINEYMSGHLPREIFVASGFDIDIVGIKRVEMCAS